MKIAMAILARENPTGLICCIQAMDAMLSGRNELTYFVRHDDDDETTPHAIDMLTAAEIKVVPVKGPRPGVLGEAWNHVARVAAEDADAVSFFSDDVFPLVHQWDYGIEEMIGGRQFDAFSWREMKNPTNITYPVVSKRWLEAVDYHLYAYWFPFWFADTWIAQVYELAKGQPMAIASDMTVGGNRPSTSNMRDVAFWVEFWKATRCLRIEEAERARVKMGWPEIDTGPIIEKLKRLDSQWNPEAIERERRTDYGPPSERYLKAKGAAQEWLDLYAQGGSYAA